VKWIREQDPLTGRERSRNPLATVPAPNQPAPALKEAAPKPFPTVQIEPQRNFPWKWVIGAIFLLAVVGGALLKFLRK